jgi:endothelin-converting enzyme
LQEYYNEDSIVDLYKHTIQRLLKVVSDEDKHDVKNAEDNSAAETEAVFQDNEETVWPPWPWPPWEGDDDKGHEPIDAKKLAKHIVRFEQKIAQASLDLCDA